MYDRISAGALDYAPYRLENSRLWLRGPRPDLGGPYCAFLGGTETYGKFLREPYPVLAGRSLGLVCANFGCLHAGIDACLKDSALLEVCSRARATVVALTGAHKLSNRFYSVHPRRNDRFIRASAALKALYPDVDFTDFHFTRHLLGDLVRRDPLAFDQVLGEIRAAWLARMRSLLAEIDGRVILLWLGERPSADDDATGLGVEPLFVTEEMVDCLRPMVPEVLDCRVDFLPPEQRGKGMVYTATEADAARELLPAAVHREVAGQVVAALRRLVL